MASLRAFPRRTVPRQPAPGAVMLRIPGRCLAPQDGDKTNSRPAGAGDAPARQEAQDTAAGTGAGRLPV